MKNEIIIVSLGSGNPDLLNVKTMDAIRNADHLVLRTSRHPFSEWLDNHHIPYSSLDHIYDSSEDFDDLSEKISSFLLHRSSESSLVYAVPDASTDQSVRALCRASADKTVIRIIPGVGISNQYLSQSLPYFQDTSVSIIPAYDFADAYLYDPNQSVLITEIDNTLLAGRIKLLLTEYLDDEHPIILIHGDSSPAAIPLYELDRGTNIDHNTAVLIPSSSYENRSRFVLNDLVSIMERLRSPNGCPWDKVQTHQSLRPYLIEESWECVDAISQNDMDHLCEELGDLLFQIVFHASVGKAYDEFTLTDVLSSVCLKMLRRHPHVFSDKTYDNPEEIRNNWDDIKQHETGHLSIISSLDDISNGLPAMKYASKTIKKLYRLESFKRSLSQVLSDIMMHAENIGNSSEKNSESELGQLLLLCSELCVISDLDGELILHQEVDRLKSSLKQSEQENH